jgi:hypothetical protein
MRLTLALACYCQAFVTVSLLGASRWLQHPTGRLYLPARAHACNVRGLQAVANATASAQASACSTGEHTKAKGKRQRRALPARQPCPRTLAGCRHRNAPHALSRYALLPARAPPVENPHPLQAALPWPRRGPLQLPCPTPPSSPLPRRSPLPCRLSATPARPRRPAAVPPLQRRRSRAQRCRLVVRRPAAAAAAAAAAECSALATASQPGLRRTAALGPLRAGSSPFLQRHCCRKGEEPALRSCGDRWRASASPAGSSSARGRAARPGVREDRLRSQTLEGGGAGKGRAMPRAVERLRAGGRGRAWRGVAGVFGRRPLWMDSQHSGPAAAPEARHLSRQGLNPLPCTRLCVDRGGCLPAP